MLRRTTQHCCSGYLVTVPAKGSVDWTEALEQASPLGRSASATEVVRLA